MAKAGLVATAAAVLVLSGCASGGGGSAGLEAEKTPTENPSIVDPATDGDTIAQTLSAGTEISAKAQTTNIVKPSYGTGLTRYTSEVALSSNGLGGYTLQYSTPGSRNGPYIRTTLISADKVSNSEDAWQRSWKEGGTTYSLALWNAGKGHREGLAQNENGQTFHKIVGYYASSDSSIYGFNSRGHAIIGNATSETVVADRTRTASYDGYFYANALVGERGDVGAPVGMRGGMALDADFDANTISGRSTSFEVEEGAGNFVSRNSFITFGNAPIVDDHRGPMGVLVGQHYQGTISSNFAPLNNGTFEGRFYGGNAQETAGVISAENAGILTEGYFTLVEQ